jgi:hypothetical protein
MRRFARENALCAVLALAGSLVMGWLGLYGYAWNDYDNEARPAFEALIHGHLELFLRIAPAYGGSFVERAPFALLPGLWGGAGLALYRTVAAPCLLAAAALGVHLVARMRRAGRTTLARAVALGVCVANPITLRALEVGHPEEILGASLCVAAVLLAAAERPLWAGLALGLAVANKEWALLAAAPVLLALPSQRRGACALVAALSAGAILAPLTLVSSGSFTAGTSAVASASSAIFQPWQLWWFLGSHGAPVHGLYGALKPGYRTGPAWASSISHPLIMIAGVAVAIALWLRTSREEGSFRARASERQALLALSLVLLLRCILDTWDTEYYALPFVFALLAWEVTGDTERPPVIALVCTVLVWWSFQWLPAHAGADTQAALYLAWSLPLAAWMGVRLTGLRPRSAARTGPARAPQEMTVSSLGRLVNTS